MFRRLIRAIFRLYMKTHSKHLYKTMSKFIIDKSMGGIILCPSVLCNYIKVYCIQCNYAAHLGTR